MTKYSLVLGLIAALASATVSLAQAVVIGAANATINEEGNNRDFTIAGNHNQIRIHGACSSIQVTGSQNKILLDKVGRITLTGAQNKVSYQSGLSTADPEIVGTGVQNRVGKSSSSETVEKTEKPSPVQSDGQSLSGEINITGDAQVINRAVNAKKVKVVGRGNNLHLSGAVEELEIIGASNIIKIDQVQRIRFLGSRNIVNYRTANKPEVSQTGEGNIATKAP